MTDETERGKSPMLYARVPADDLAEAQQVADAEYDGNLSLLVRIAVKRFIADRPEKVVTTDAERIA